MLAKIVYVTIYCDVLTSFFLLLLLLLPSRHDCFFFVRLRFVLCVVPMNRYHHKLLYEMNIFFAVFVFVLSIFHKFLVFCSFLRGPFISLQLFYWFFFPVSFCVESRAIHFGLIVKIHKSELEWNFVQFDRFSTSIQINVFHRNRSQQRGRKRDSARSCTWDLGLVRSHIEIALAQFQRIERATHTHKSGTFDQNQLTAHKQTGVDHQAKI